MSLSRRLSFTSRLPIAYMGLMLVSMGSFGALTYWLSQDRTVYLEYTFELLAVALAAVSAAGLLGWLFARSIAGPLAAFGQSVQSATRHEFDQAVWGLGRNDEFGDIAASLSDLRDALQVAEWSKAEGDAKQQEQEHVVAELGGSSGPPPRHR
jgi:methyl-accepting chemotaxis protein